MKTMRTIVGIMFVLWIMWITFSWVDILAHNSPIDGDRKYSPINMFVLFEELYE